MCFSAWNEERSLDEAEPKRFQQKPIPTAAKPGPAARGESTKHALDLQMPGTPQQAAEEIRDEGPEGAPADAKSGPGLLRIEMLGIAALLVVAAAGIGFWFGWGVGLVALAIFMVGFVLNPAVLNTSLRAKERKEVIQHREARTGGLPNSR
ncbi:MAG TPA: hypothetical protein VG797_11370 [Phycisphaerales bacterium]|nr:hypothetical protein [Phycisphaerales bacterium]